MQQEPKAYNRRHQKNSLRRNHAAEIALAEKQKTARKTGIILRAHRDSLGESAEQRISAQRDDQRRYVEPRDQRPIQRSSEQADDEREQQSHSDGYAGIVPQPAETDGAQPHHRSHRKIDSARDNHRRQRQREKSDFHSQ